jgi:mono/diheme cytochrome c family protein
VKSADKRVIQLLIVMILFSGVAILVERSLIASPGDAIQAADKKDPSGMASAHPPGDDTKGEELYKASCVVCHGPHGMGGIGPRLAGNPVLSNEQAFWKTVYEGRHVMPPLKGAVTEQQMADIQAWLKTLR